MFGKSIKLFRLLGFEVKIDFSWIIIAVLVAWSLSTGLFPLEFKNLSTQAYWLMGIVGALGLFLSMMNQNGASRLMVVEGGRLVGIIALKDMLKFLSLKVELDQ